MPSDASNTLEQASTILRLYFILFFVSILCGQIVLGGMKTKDEVNSCFSLEKTLLVTTCE